MTKPPRAFTNISERSGWFDILSGKQKSGFLFEKIFRAQWGEWVKILTVLLTLDYCNGLFGVHMINYYEIYFGRTSRAY